MTANTNPTTPGAAALPCTFGGFTIPAGCRRIFITAQLETSNGDPRIQPTGFPDLGPVLYPDPSGEHGNICLIESEASMANRLEEVCLANKYEGTLRTELDGIPYLRAEEGKEGNKVFKTASTIDGHRFASDYLAKGKAKFNGEASEQTLAEYIKSKLGIDEKGKSMPIARIPEMFALVFELDTMSLIHGYQISNEQISFVGLRHPRALSASIIGLGCERVTVPGVKFNVGQVESEAGQAIFHKPRITATTIEARFSIDVGLLMSLSLVAPEVKEKRDETQKKRTELLLSLALWKVAAFLDLLSVELSLRSECKLRLKRGGTDASSVQATIDNGPSTPFPFSTIVAAPLIKEGVVPEKGSPLVLNFA